MRYSEKERISHVFRRLGFGTQPDLVESADSVDDAISVAMDLTKENPEPPRIEPPDDGRDDEAGAGAFRYWIEMLVRGPRRVEERLVWFWHDHFATDARKVRLPFLLFTQHLTLRRNATASFSDLLYEIATDPAMLLYLDGRENSVENPNENFGREVLELHTLGRGNYTEADVLASSRSFSGWVVVPPDSPAIDILDIEPWSAFFVDSRHDAGEKTLLGVTGRHDARGAVDILLDHPATAPRLAGKLYAELVGLSPDERTVDRLGDVFRRDYRILDLVDAVVSDPAFISDDAVRAKKRSPLEQAIGVAQAFGTGERADRALERFLTAAGYVPYRPPNPAGYPKGGRLLGAYAMVHTFDLVAVVPERTAGLSLDEMAMRLGLFDLAPATRSAVAAAASPQQRLALLLNSPEYHVV